MILGNFLINFFDVGGIFFFLLNVLISSDSFKLLQNGLNLKVIIYFFEIFFI